MPLTRRKAKEAEENRVPEIETSDADLLSGPDTAESLISGPQSMKSEASVKTETSVKTEASVNKTSIKTEAFNTKPTDDAGKPSPAPSSSTPTTPKSGSDSLQSAASVGDGDAVSAPATAPAVAVTATAPAAAAAPAAALAISVPRGTPKSSPAAAVKQQEEENARDSAETLSERGSAAGEGDLDDALSGALCAPRNVGNPPPGTAVASGEPAGNASTEGMAGKDTPKPKVGITAGRVEVETGRKQEYWGGQSEGMFRKRVSEELKAMLRSCGGRCEMSSIAKLFKRRHKRVLNLQGKKLRALLITGSGLYGIGLYGHGQDGEIRLEEKSVVEDSNSDAATGPNNVGDRGSTQPLTRTFVNQNALRNQDSRSRGRSPKGRGDSCDEPDQDPPGAAGHSARSALARPTLGPLGSSVGYARSRPDSAGAPARSRRDADARVGREWSRSRSPPPRRHSSSRSRSWDKGVPGGHRRDGRLRPAHGASRSSSRGRRFSRTAARPSIHERNSPHQRRRGRSPSPRGRTLSSRELSPRSSSRRNSGIWHRSHSRSPRRRSPYRRGSPARRLSPSRHTTPPRRRPPRGVGRHDSAERGPTRRSREDLLDGSSDPRGRHGSTRPAAGRDRDMRSRAVSSRKATREHSLERPEEGGMRPGDSVRRGGCVGTPSRSGRSASPVGYGTEPPRGTPEEARKGQENGRSAVGRGAVGGRMMDPVISLARGGTPAPPVAGAVRGRPATDPVIPLALGGAPVPALASSSSTRHLVEGTVGSGGGFPSNFDPPGKLYHAGAGPPGCGDGYSVGNGHPMAGDWLNGDGVGGSQVGLGQARPVPPHPAPALLPPPSSLRPLPLMPVRPQGARLMIKGTHPAVPERRIHALVSTFGVVGKIEVLEGFVFVHMKSLEEATRALTGLNGKVVPHVSPQPSDRAGAAPLPLAAAIWREEQYQALMSRENMRIFADSMRRASTWYEKQTKSGFNDTLGEPIPCRFFSLGRGCIFGKNCGFSHDQRPRHPTAAASTHRSAGGPGFAAPLSKPPSVIPSPALAPTSTSRAGAVPNPFRQERVPVLAHHEQSPTLTFVHRDEMHRRSGPGAQEDLKPDPTGAYTGSGVGVATPWQPEHEAGGISGAGQVLPQPGATSDGHVDRQEQTRGDTSPQHFPSPPALRNGPGRMRSSASPTTISGNAGRSGYQYKSHSHRADGRGGGNGSGSGGGDSRRDRDGRNSGGRSSWREEPHGRNSDRERNDLRRSSPVSSRGRSRRDASPISAHARKRGRGSSSHRSSPPRSSGGYEKNDERESRYSRNAVQQPGRGHSGSRRSESLESVPGRGSRRHRLDGRPRQRRDSRSTIRPRSRRGDRGDRNGRSSTRDERPFHRRRSRDSASPVGEGRRYRDDVSPVVKGRRYESDSGDFTFDGRRSKKSRNERETSRGRRSDRPTREDSGGERGMFLGRGSGRRGSDKVSHGWASPADNPGAFSRDDRSRSYGGAPRGDLYDAGSSGVPHREERYVADRSISPNSSAGWDSTVQDEFTVKDEFMVEDPPRPTKTQFTVTARLGSLQPPPVPAPAGAARPSTRFSITMPSNMAGVAGPTSPSGGVRRGGRPARGRGRGGRGDTRRDAASRRPPRDVQDDEGYTRH